MNLEELRELGEMEQQRQSAFKHRILYCSSAGCVPSSGDSIKDVLLKTLEEKGLAKSCEAIGTGCLGMCGEGPNVVVCRGGTAFQRCTGSEGADIMDEVRKQLGPSDR